MNVFRPYKTLHAGPDLIHLQQPRWRKIFVRSFLFFMPFLLLSFTILLTLLLRDSDFSIWPRLGFVVIMLFTIYLLLSAEVVLEIMITPAEIRQRYVSKLRTRYRLIKVEDIRCIMLEKIYVRSRGYYYTLSMKDGSRKALLSLPRFSMDPEEEADIKRQLQQCTGLSVEKFTL
jgi:Ca2+/Na+ antiporter